MSSENFKVQAEQFADIEILRYQVPGFNELPLRKKILIYYLYMAAMSGRDITYDQNYKYNLLIRKTNEGIYEGFTGNRDDENFAAFLVYSKRVWFSNGIHHHYSMQKFYPDVSPEYFKYLLQQTPVIFLPLREGENLEQFISFILPLIYDKERDTMRVNQASGVDVIKDSANNFYENLTQDEVTGFYQSQIDKSDPRPISYGLNSKLVKENGTIFEKVWKAGGMYSPAIEKIIYWLSKAESFAENEVQKKTIQLLIEYYQTGDLRKFDEYSIHWLQDTVSEVDFINGFIETYGDPLNYKATYEALVAFRDKVATGRIEAISNNAQWFEDNSPIFDEHKKRNVKGISAKVITVVAEAGDASPATPIGINLPNATWIREQFGSKSVNLGNIVHSYNLAASEKVLEEFAFSEEEKALAKQYGNLADDLHTDLHEVIGHGSGQILPGVGTPRETLKVYASVIEETRADLVALYFILDTKLVQLGIMPNTDCGKAEYNRFIRNGMLTQLQRIKPGENIEEAHMRNRQLIAHWAFELGKEKNVIERINRDGKTFFVINDYEELRVIFGKMLREIQRITSEGDFSTAEYLVERYGVKVDEELHKEVLSRFAGLNIPPYKGFINPELQPIYSGDEIVDVYIEYPDDFAGQMMRYAKEFSFL